MSQMNKLIVTSLFFVSSVLSFNNAQAACYGTAGDFYCNQQNYEESMRIINTPPPTYSNSNETSSSNSYSYQAPMKASQYGAVAWDYGRGVWGYSVLQPTQKAANSSAIADCGLRTCKVVSKFANTWVAMSFGHNQKRGFSSVQGGLTKSIAEQKALASCISNATDCQIILSESSLP